MPDDIPVVDAGGVADTGPADTAANPVVMINHPSDMEAGRNARNDIPFIGVARDVRGTALTGMALSWNDSVAGSMGTGASISYRLSAGMHTITLTASDLEGRMGSDSIQLLVAP